MLIFFDEDSKPDYPKSFSDDTSFNEKKDVVIHDAPPWKESSLPYCWMCPITVSYFRNAISYNILPIYCIKISTIKRD